MTTYCNYPFETNYKYSSLIDLLQYRARNQPEQIAYRFVRQGTNEIARITYQEMDLQAKMLAAALQSVSFVGERALLLYPPGLEFVTAFFGCMYAGVIAVPVHPPRRNQNILRLQTLISEAEAKIALTTQSLLTDIKNRFTDQPELKQLSWLTTDNLPKKSDSFWLEPKTTGDTLAFLQYTSGSTGTPKGVMITHNNLLHNERMIAKAFGHTLDTTVVGWLPLFHDMGLIGNVLQPLYLGRPCILMSPIDFLQKPLRWLQAISHFQATTSGGPNFAYDLCVRKIKPEQKANLDLSNWEVAFTGAEPIRAETLKLFADTFKECGFRPEAFYPCYGMAETTLFVTGGLKTTAPVVHQIAKANLGKNQVLVNSANTGVQKVVSCGQSWHGTQVRIIDPKSLTPCKSNQIGEIWVSGKSVAQGYWNRPLETEQTFKASMAGTNENIFLRTGDLGFIRDNELSVTGRLKDVIIIRGQNYYPQDIEQTIAQSHSALRIEGTAAFGIEVKGLERLVIVQEIERSYLHRFDINEIVESLLEAVTAEYGLQIYATVLIKPGSIPKTSSGKIQRYVCRTRFLNGSLNVVEDWSKNPQYRAKFIRLQAEIESVLNKATSQLDLPK